MRLSLWVGLGMFFGKGLAWLLTGSSAILSDAAESVVHVFAVGFAAWSLRLFHQPADDDHLYGHEKVSYLSAGFEGAAIGAAAIFILYDAITSLIEGPELHRLDAGAILISIATLANAALGGYLIRTGKREQSLILVANGKHVLTDSFTSLGVLIAIGLVWLTGWTPLDPIIAIVVALHILRSGIDLMRDAVHGLMDRSDPAVDQKLRAVLEQWSSDTGGEWHELRHRISGDVVWIEVHVLMDGATAIEPAHAEATRLEGEIRGALPHLRVEIVTHLEPLDEHDRDHPKSNLLV